MNAASPTPGTMAVREQLARILADSRFVRSERLLKFLRFTIEKTLAGEGASLKEYLIAVEVYGKPESYDPTIESLVRVEASRLRGKLRDYYNTAGSSDQIVIEYPNGQYGPVFHFREPGIQLVRPHEAEPETPAQATTANATAQEDRGFPLAV